MDENKRSEILGFDSVEDGNAAETDNMNEQAAIPAEDTVFAQNGEGETANVTQGDSYSGERTEGFAGGNEYFAGSGAQFQPERSYTPEIPFADLRGHNHYSVAAADAANKNKPRFSVLTLVVSVVCALAVGVGSSLLVLANCNGTVSGGSTGSTVKNIVVSDESETMVEAVYEKCADSIVGVRTTSSLSSFFGGSQEVSGEGSGIVYSSDGYIITNYHVIAASSSSSTSSYFGQNSSSSSVADKIEVYLPSDPETAISATVVGYNISSDLAVLKINKTGLTAIEIGDSDTLKVGQNVVAIGNPGGLQFMGSVTSGVIGGLNRTLTIDSIGTMKLIQTDAAINPGNSGGALVNSEGKLIGINSSKLVNTSYEGMGFAIPVNDAIKICKKLISNEGTATPYIGVNINTKYTSEVLKYYGFPSGAVVNSVDDGGPADNAGIQRGDIITKFGDTEISEYTVLGDALNQCSSGDTVKVEIYRSGSTKTVEVKIGESKN